MKQKDVEDKFSRKTVWKLSPGVFIKINLVWKGFASLCLKVVVLGGLHLALISWLLLLLEATTSPGNPYKS